MNSSIPESSVIPSFAGELAFDNSAEQASGSSQFYTIAIQEFHAARSRARESRKTRLQTSTATAVTIIVSIWSAVALIVTDKDTLLTGLILVGLMLGGFGLSLTAVRAIRTVLKDHCEVLEAQLNATRLYELARRYEEQQKKNEIMTRAITQAKRRLPQDNPQEGREKLQSQLVAQIFTDLW